MPLNFQDGKAYKETCSEGLVFNPNIDNCDLASNYQCGRFIEQTRLTRLRTSSSVK